MARRIVIEMTKKLVIETDNVDDLSAQGVLDWIGMSGAMVFSLKFNGDEVVPGTELGQSYAPAPVISVENKSAMHISGEAPAGSDWPA